MADLFWHLGKSLPEEGRFAPSKLEKKQGSLNT
jgi:hypothetical protein